MGKKWVNDLITERLQLAKENGWDDEVKELEQLIAKREQRKGVVELKVDEKAMTMEFDSEGFIKEMESMSGIDDTLLNYEDYEEEQEQMTEREFRGGI